MMMKDNMAHKQYHPRVYQVTDMSDVSIFNVYIVTVITHLAQIMSLIGMEIANRPIWDGTLCLSQQQWI